MKRVLFFFLMPIALGLSAQSFQEVCVSSNTNGTVVQYQHFNDTLYATGFFNQICGKSAAYIAKWENEEWEPSSISIDDPGHALRVVDDKLYIAKYEESIDSNWVYVYDNASLEKVGEGVYLTTASGFSELPNIYDITEYNGSLIACGEFDQVGGASIQGIMQWDGSAWQAIGSGLEGNIQNTAPVMFPHQMMVYDDALYVVGNFRIAGGEEVNGVAKWDGTEWSSMGNGFNSTVYSIAVFNGEIIAGGSFTESNGATINRIAKWDGTSWLPLEFGFTSSSVNDFIFVHTLKVIDDELYIGGGLKEITYGDNTTEECGGIISYDGNTINTFNGGVQGNDIEAIAKIDDQHLLIGGGVLGSGYTGITDLTATNAHSLEVNNNVEVYPNPFERVINIHSHHSFERYEVINAMGVVVSSGLVDDKLFLDLPAGVYFLKLIDNGKHYIINKVIRR